MTATSNEEIFVLALNNKISLKLPTVSLHRIRAQADNARQYYQRTYQVLKYWRLWQGVRTFQHPKVAWRLNGHKAMRTLAN